MARSTDGPTYNCCGSSVHVGHAETCYTNRPIMKRVIIESPYMGEVDANVRYARRAIRDSISRDEAPIASHLLYTVQRMLGINCGLAWMSQADMVAFYVDRGMSHGMKNAEREATRLGIAKDYRLIGETE